ncbi:serine hydrolase [Emcibacter sp.]|uniref:serine hydrolase n=1 Tax=Emcibacter sp. TaxID=1979954 RepID=UPI002AA86A6C|nr:serine hydrolase [Emcibacter sp.]
MKRFLAALIFFLAPSLAQAGDRVRVSSEGAVAQKFAVTKDEGGRTEKPGHYLDEMPSFEMTFSPQDAFLANPDRERILITDHPRWDLILLPWETIPASGKDGYLVEEVLPFALMEKEANCLHYGTIKFPALSRQERTEGKAVKARFEITAETCSYLHFTMDGEITLQIVPADMNDQVEDKTDLLSGKPDFYLYSDYPGFNFPRLAQADHIPPADMTTYGAVIDGIHYGGRCQSDGACNRLPLPSYSLAKSLVAGLGLMRLEKLYPGAKETLVSDYVRSCRDAGWDGVTFGHLLDMTSGHYKSKKPHQDENEYFWPFSQNKDADGKTDYACTAFGKKDEPGETWVYRTSDTWILGMALQAFWREKSGQAEADFYDDLIVPLWRDLGLTGLIEDTRRTQDAAKQPYSGWGLVFFRKDIAAIAHALASEDSRLTDKLDRHMLSAALQRDPDNHGKKAGGKTLRYKNGFWAWNAGDYLGCKKDTWLPVMSGFGGISVVMLPTGDVYYYFSDSGIFRYGEAIAEIHKIRPVCEGRK